MKRLHPQWVASDDQIDAELAAAADAEAGLEELADLFAAEPVGVLQDPPQAPPASAGPQQRRSKRPRRQLVSISFGSQDAVGQSQGADGNLLQVTSNELLYSCRPESVGVYISSSMTCNRVCGTPLS